MQILQLEKRLQDQVVVRCALEKGLGYQSSSHDVTNETSVPKVAAFCLNLLKCPFPPLQPPTLHI